MRSLEQPAKQEISSTDNEPLSREACRRVLGIDAPLVCAFQAGNANYGIFKIENSACIVNAPEKQILSEYALIMFDPNDPNNRVIPGAILELNQGDDIIFGRETLGFVKDPSLSREHARIKVDGNVVTVTDVGSTNGTLDIFDTISDVVNN